MYVSIIILLCMYVCVCTSAHYLYLTEKEIPPKVGCDFLEPEPTPFFLLIVFKIVFGEGEGLRDDDLEEEVDCVLLLLLEEEENVVGEVVVVVKLSTSSTVVVEKKSA